MWVLHLLQHLQFVVDHLLVSANVLLQDDLDSDLALGAVGLANNAIGAGTQGSAEAVAGSAFVVLSIIVACEGR